MNTKGKIDFTKTDNIQFIEEVASEITYELEDTLDLKSTMRSVFWYASSRY